MYLYPEGKRLLKRFIHNELFCFRGKYVLLKLAIYPLRFTSLPTLVLLTLNSTTYQPPSRDCTWRYNFLKDKWREERERKTRSIKWMKVIRGQKISPHPPELRWTSLRGHQQRPRSKRPDGLHGRRTQSDLICFNVRRLHKILYC